MGTKMTEEEFLVKCLEFLDYFHVDYTKDVIELTSGNCSCIMNPKSDFYELFGGQSINGVARYVAEKLNKKTKYISDFDDYFDD
jgi:hypothetical protein